MKRFLLGAMFLVAACGGSQSEPAPPTDPVATEPTQGEPSTTPPGPGGCVAQGCSSTVCAPEGEGVMTTCEWKPEYACYKTATCERQPSGECGWTQTAELSSCLAAPPAGG
jgi:hypothetical protein